MEFEGFSFDANQFLALPGLNENKEVLAVLRHSPETVVGANKPFMLKQKKQSKSSQKQANNDLKVQQYGFAEVQSNQYDENLGNYQIVYDFEEQEQEDKGRNQIMDLWRGVHQKRWFFIGGDLYINLDVFSADGQKKRDTYSHWNEWRPHSNFQGFKHYIQLNMRTDNEAPSEFSNIINYLQSMQIKEAFQVSAMLQRYSLMVKQEIEMCKKIKSFCEDHFEHLQECLADNYNSSLEKANEILNGIGQEYPFVYFIRRNNYRSLRMQVSSIGFNYLFTEILCENRDKYLQSLQRNGFQEVFSNYTHYQLLMMNLLQQNEAEIEIVTLDDIIIPCKIKAIQHDLTTFNLAKDIQFTNQLRIYKFEIDEYQIKRIAKIRSERPLEYVEGACDFEYNFNCDQFLQQYYHYFSYQKNSSSNYSKQKLSIGHFSDCDKLNITSTSTGSSGLNSSVGEDINTNQNQSSQETSSTQGQNLQEILKEQILVQPSLTQIQSLQNNIIPAIQPQQDNIAFQQQISQPNLIQQNSQLLINNPNLSQQYTNPLSLNEIQNNNIQIQQQQQILQLINSLSANQNQSQQQQFIPQNTQLNPQQQLIIPSTTIDQINLNSLLMFQPYQIGLTVPSIEQQQIDILAQIQQQKLVQQTQQQELDKMNELQTQLSNDLAVKLPLYIQLKQIQINSELSQQLNVLNSAQVQYIQSYEQSQQLLNYVQIQINQLLIQLSK